MEVYRLKKLIKKLIYKEKADSNSYIKWMRKQGARVGERTVVFAPNKTLIDMTRPWLVDIGNDVQITEGVKILTHGDDWSVLKVVYGKILGSSGKVKIGNNVFIGMNTIILKGVSVGDNVIIGAGSLVNKNIPDNCVVAGNPAKIIMSLEDYYKKRQELQVEESKELIREYRNAYNENPTETHMNEFFWLFADGDNQLPKCWDNMMSLGGNKVFSMKVLNINSKKYNSMRDLLEDVK